MKKSMILLSILVIGAFVLSACSGSGGETTPMGTEGIPQTGGTETFPTDSFGVTSMPTMGVETSMPTMGVETGMPTSSLSTSVSTATSQVGGVVNTPVGTAMPTSQGSIPGTGSSLVQLSTMMNFRVQDSNGNDLGRVTDYVVNVCEAHITYIVVNTNSAGTGGSGNNVVLIPYQAATTLNGQLGAGVNSGGSASGTAVSGTPASDASSGNLNNAGQGDVLVVNIGSADLSTFPAIRLQDLDMNDVSWETDVVSFWSPFMKVGLTTACRVPSGSGTVMPTAVGPDVVGTPTTGGTPITSANPTPASGSERVTVNKVALASAILNADLEAGNGGNVGKIRDAVIIRNTGGILYYITQAVAGNQQSVGTPVPDGTAVPAGTDQAGATSSGSTLSSNNAAGQVALPPGAVNVRHDGSRTVFYLLVPTSVFTGSPAFMGDFNSFNTTNSEWFDYWSQYIPMTQSDLPK